MLRVLVLALLLANGVYLVWAQGLLTAYGFGPVIQAEPERLNQQINPEAIQLLEVSVGRPSQQASFTGVPPPRPAASAPSPTPAASMPAVPQPPAPPPAPAAPVCLQAGLFTERQVNAMRPRLQARLPADSWKFESTAEPARWIVYMGKYISRDAMNRKRVLLEQKGVPYQMPVSPALTPGLVLGSYNTKADAEAAQDKLNERGIRSARVVPERPEVPTHWLKLPAADAALQAKVKTFIPMLSGKRLQACG
jgi:hypothetical protein